MPLAELRQRSWAATRAAPNSEAASQYTQGMPYGAFALAVTAPPAWPLLAAEVAVAEGAVAEAGPEPDEDAPRSAGTEVDVVPSSISTCPAATELAAVAVAPK